jgi:hypothetical protein
MAASYAPNDASYGKLWNWLGLSVGVMLCVSMIVIAAEGAVSSTVLGTWAESHHRFRRSAFSNVKVFAGSLFLTWIAATSTINVVAARFGGFNKIPASEGWPSRLLDSMRFAWVSLIAQNDAEPVEFVAKLTTFCVQITGTAFILGVIGVFGGKLFGESHYLPKGQDVETRTVGAGGDTVEKTGRGVEGRRFRKKMGSGGAVIALGGLAYLAWQLWQKL